MLLLERFVFWLSRTCLAAARYESALLSISAKNLTGSEVDEVDTRIGEAGNGIIAIVVGPSAWTPI